MSSPSPEKKTEKKKISEHEIDEIEIFEEDEKKDKLEEEKVLSSEDELTDTEDELSDGEYIDEIEIFEKGDDSEDDSDVYKRYETVVHPDERITSDILSLPELTEVIGTRITHIANGAPIYVEVGDLTDEREIAMKEIMEKKCPLKIRRRVGDTFEERSVNEMSIPNVSI